MKNVPKKINNKKTGLLYKKVLFPKQKKNLTPFRSDVPIRSNALRTLGAGPASNREIMKPVRILVFLSNRLNCPWI